MNYINMFSPDFLVGLGFGFVIGSIIVELLWYSYWKSELYPLYAFAEAKKNEEELHKLLEEGVEKGYYTKEEVIIGGKND